MKSSVPDLWFEGGELRLSGVEDRGGGSEEGGPVSPRRNGGYAPSGGGGPPEKSAPARGGKLMGSGCSIPPGPKKDSRSVHLLFFLTFNYTCISFW